MHTLLSTRRASVAILVMAGSLACSDLGTEPAIEYLEVRYLSGYIYANMMPVVPPLPNDRIYCSQDLIVRNSSAQRRSVRLRVLEGELRRWGTRTRLGTLYFLTDWDGVLEPFATDTVRLFKRDLSDDFLQPECDAAVEIDFEIGEAEDLLIRFSSGPLTFSCVE